MYDRQITPDQELTFGVSGMLYRNGLVMYDHQTESLWSQILGQAISGELAGTRLQQVPITYSFWFGWIDYHPESSSYRRAS